MYITSTMINGIESLHAICFIVLLNSFYVFYLPIFKCSDDEYIIDLAAVVDMRCDVM